MQAADSTRRLGLHVAYALLVTTLSAAMFYAPALRVTHGTWPLPLDDAYIHFDFARAAAAGHPSAWIAGQGYSSGETSPLYAAVLTLGALFGWSGGFAAFVAVASVASTMVTMGALIPRPRWLPWLTAPLVTSIGLLDWSLWSGMEAAFFFAILSRAWLSLRSAILARGRDRTRLAWATGAWGAPLVWTRPEAAVIVFVLGVTLARAARERSPWPALFRVWAPGAGATLVVLGTNLALTGHAAAAGARLKLLSSNPYASDVDRAREFGLNVFNFVVRAAADVAPLPALAWLLPALALASLTHSRTRELGAAALIASALYTLLVSCNGAARFQNFRYYAPALELLLIASALGAAALASRSPRLSACAILGVTASAMSRWAPEIALFRDASQNIRDQQVEVGRRLASTTDPSAILLLGDAGAIPFFSGRHAIDALGLGGYHGEPFVDAAVQGEGSTVELLQSLPRALRPTHLALYPNWFPAITKTFGRELERVTLAHNVICGGATKVIYKADWSALDTDAPPSGRVLDEIDVADVKSEASHDYRSPAPVGGWTLLDVRPGPGDAGVFDAGRITPEGRRETFAVRRWPTAVEVVVRTDGKDGDADVLMGDVRVALGSSRAPKASWGERRARLPRVNDVLSIEATRGALRDFHVWLIVAD